MCAEGDDAGLLQLIPHLKPALGIVRRLIFVMQLQVKTLIRKSTSNLLQRVQERAGGGTGFPVTVTYVLPCVAEHQHGFISKTVILAIAGVCLELALFNKLIWFCT